MIDGLERFDASSFGITATDLAALRDQYHETLEVARGRLELELFDALPLDAKEVSRQ